jgi:hypothetical protein
MLAWGIAPGIWIAFEAARKARFNRLLAGSESRF